MWNMVNSAIKQNLFTFYASPLNTVETDKGSCVGL